MGLVHENDQFPISPEWITNLMKAYGHLDRLKIEKIVKDAKMSLR